MFGVVPFLFQESPVYLCRRCVREYGVQNNWAVYYDDFISKASILDTIVTVIMRKKNELKIQQFLAYELDLKSHFLTIVIEGG